MPVSSGEIYFNVTRRSVDPDLAGAALLTSYVGFARYDFNNDAVFALLAYEIKLDISAYQIALWGVQVKINFNKDLVKLHSVVADTDIFADTVATSANGVATITSYVGNDEHEKLQNKVVNGKNVAYATVYFEVLDNAAAYSVLDFEFNVATYVVDKDQKVIDVTLDGIDL